MWFRVPFDTRTSGGCARRNIEHVPSKFGASQSGLPIQFYGSDRPPCKDNVSYSAYSCVADLPLTPLLNERPLRRVGAQPAHRVEDLDSTIENKHSAGTKYKYAYPQTAPVHHF